MDWFMDHCKINKPHTEHNRMWTPWLCSESSCFSVLMIGCHMTATIWIGGRHRTQWLLLYWAVHALALDYPGLSQWPVLFSQYLETPLGSPNIGKWKQNCLSSRLTWSTWGIWDPVSENNTETLKVNLPILVYYKELSILSLYESFFLKRMRSGKDLSILWPLFSLSLGPH